ncbi:Hypothetical protein NTJ_03423 [Nesidiocoris tenuis]|uniref:Peptidase S8 pro-domain domain-containing protein n=1 Tax=Nesidiocoris tenuis TaxID=355587 RepID=A0ABN7AHC9_9HEMI|nr:Hypothetical protein NTJ_03423 [Nesidiocoris tenuis]
MSSALPVSVFAISLMLALGSCPGEGATGVVQAVVYGLIGSPVYHKEVPVKLDPGVGQRRNPGFEAIHGHKAVHLIERLGLGMDGREAQRLEAQRIRDARIPYEDAQLNYVAPNY